MGDKNSMTAQCTMFLWYKKVMAATQLNCKSHSGLVLNGT